MKILRTLIEICLFTTVFLSCTPRDRYITLTGYAQGGTYTIKMNLNGKDGMIGTSPEAIKVSVDSILSDIDNSLSGYNKNSLLSRFNNGSSIIPDSIFIDIYSKGREIFEETSGVVDIASGPLFDLWGFGFRSGDMPTDGQVAECMKGCGMGRMHPDMSLAISADGTLDGMSMLVSEKGEMPILNYNAIAQGYSCDLVADYLYSIGVRDMMVDIGEIFCDGLNPSGKPWTLGIDKPIDGNNELGAHIQGIFRAPEGPHGIVTSGNYRKFYLREGKKYSHSIDPRTGYPVSHNLLSATIVAPDALSADAYATYCMVIGMEESMKFIEGRNDLEGCLIYDDNGEFKTWCSKGFTLEDI